MPPALYAPREIEVLQRDSGEPDMVGRRGVRRRVATVHNSWRIDDEWWREQISRHYFQIELDNGLIMTVFRDLISGKWYRQQY